MRAVLVLSVIASTAYAAPAKLPDHYAKLFEQDRVVVFDVLHTYPDFEQAERKNLRDKPVTTWPRKRDRSVIKCKVTRVVKFSTSIASQVECDAELDPMVPHIDGIYLATADGLYSLGEMPTTEADLPKADELIIAAAPRAFQTVVPQPNNDGKGVTGVRQNRGNWCTYSELTGAYHGHNARSFSCFGRGTFAEIYVLDDSYRLRDWWLRAR